MKLKRDLKQAGEEFLKKNLPSSFRANARLRMLGLLQIPVLFFIGPKVLRLDDEECSIAIPLNRRTRNHLKSMYFGVLAAGADVSCGLLAWHLSDEYAQGRVILVFKDFKADFLKRAEGDTVFTCRAGSMIREAVQKALETKERQNLEVPVTAFVPKISFSEPVAEFTLTLSLKYK